MHKKYQVFISSTYTDLIEIRREVAQSVLRLTEIPAAMEDFGAIDQSALSYIKSVIDRCDYYVLIIAGRYGSIDETGVSFTEQEYDYALEKGKTILVFIRKDIDNIPSKQVETDNNIRSKLEKFREKVSRGRLVEFWDDAQRLHTSVAIALSNAFRDHPGVGWIRADTVDERKSIEVARLEYENQNLRDEINKLKDSIRNYSIDHSELLEMHSIVIQWDYAGRNYERAIELSWLEIFKIIGPIIRRYVKINRVREKLTSIVTSVFSVDTPGISLAEIPSYVHEDIEFYFMGHEIIEIRNDAYFYLTARGRSLLAQLARK
jgi:hypothetical protein